jgi:hypothetical protein
MRRAPQPWWLMAILAIGASCYGWAVGRPAAALAGVAFAVVAVAFVLDSRP